MRQRDIGIVHADFASVAVKSGIQPARHGHAAPAGRYYKMRIRRHAFCSGSFYATPCIERSRYSTLVRQLRAERAQQRLNIETAKLARDVIAREIGERGVACEFAPEGIQSKTVQTALFPVRPGTK